jgi:spermidine synthase
LRDIGFVSAIDLMSSYAGRGPDLAAWLKDAAINTDRDLRLQYLAGMGLNAAVQNQIFSDLMEARRIPPGLFVGSAETVAELHSAIENNKFSSDAVPFGQR